jgi:DeoR family transcriptional regulator, fructose operon transcriptional repressor
MLLDKRRVEILDIVERNGFASLHELVEHLGASESTVRRDLEYLDGLGHIRRLRGGAAYTGESITPFEERTDKAKSQKQQIARYIASRIQPGETVLLDGGTTTLEVARCLQHKSLQVVTNSLPIANLLVNAPEIELIFVGGYLYPRTGVALGAVATAALQQLHVGTLIMSVGGMTEKGLFNSNTLLVEAERQMIAAAERVIVAMDSGKLGRSALVHLCELSAVDEMVIDAGCDEHWKHIIEGAGLKLSIVPNERA